MALTVEDGTGLADADAFVSLTDCDAYHTARGNSAWTGTDADKESAIRRATAFMTYAFTWKGFPLNGRDQALAWPRSGVTDNDGYYVAVDEVPREVVDATCEAALRELESPGSLYPDVTLTDRVKSEQVGPLRVEYFANAMSAEASRLVVTIIRDLVRGLLKASGGIYSGRAVRA